MSERYRSARQRTNSTADTRAAVEKRRSMNRGKPVAILKIGLPSRLSAKCGESVYNIVLDKLNTQKVNLLLDASDIVRVDQEGLRWLYEVCILLKARKLPKIVIRKPSRTVRDAMIFSNIIKCFDIEEDVHG